MGFAALKTGRMEWIRECPDGQNGEAVYKFISLYACGVYKNRAMARLFAMFRRFVETLRATSVRNG